METLRIQSNKNESAVIKTYPHKCDAGRFERTEKSANLKTFKLPSEMKIQEGKRVEREHFLKPSLPIAANTYQKHIFEEKIPLPKRHVLSPETVNVLENAEKLVENVHKRITEINQYISFHKENLEMPELEPTIDEDLLRLRQIVALRFQQANNPTRVQNADDYRDFTNSIQQVSKKDITKSPRLLKLVTTLPQKCILNTKDEEFNYKKRSSCEKHKLLSTDTKANQFHTNDHIENDVPKNLNENTAQADKKEGKSETSVFQIQNGPKLVIKRSLQIQNVEHLHISPETSLREPVNVGIYNFQHETSSEKNYFDEEQFITEDDRDRQVLNERILEKKQFFRKSVVMKKSDDSSKAILENISEANKFKKTNIDNTYQNTSMDGLITQSPREITATNLIKSPKTCNTENAKTKAYIEFLSSLERDSDYCATNNRIENSEVDQEIKIPDHKNEKLPSKPLIISNEKVNLRYKDILKGSKVNPTVLNDSFSQIDKNSRDTEIEVDNINLKQPCVLDLDKILRTNDEILDTVINNTDTMLKIESSKIQTQNSVIKQEPKKVDNKIEFSPVESLNSLEKNLNLVKGCILSSTEHFSTEKEIDFKFNDVSDKMLDRIISGTNTFSKFISPRSEINGSVINQESGINSQSVNLSSTSVSLMSSTKNVFLQKPLSSETKQLSLAPSNVQGLNKLKDMNMKTSSEEIKTANDLSIEVILERNPNKISEKNSKIENDEIEEKQKDEDDNCDRKEPILKELSGNEEMKSLSKNLSFNPSSDVDLSSNILNINYSKPSFQIKENSYDEIKILDNIFESLKYSSSAMKRFTTCLFGEIEPRIENEIIGILREINVHPTIINKFFLILQNRDKNSELSTFTTNLLSYLNLIENKKENNSVGEDFLEERSKIISENTETDGKLKEDEATNEKKNISKKSNEVKLNSNETLKYKNNIDDDLKLTVTQDKTNIIKDQEKSDEVFIKMLTGISSSENPKNTESNKKDEILEPRKNMNDNSLEIQLQEKNKNLNILEKKTSSILEIKSMVDSRSSVSESIKSIDYSQNFTDSSSTSKDCKSLESHFSLKLSDSFTSKKEVPLNEGTAAERSDELEIQRKIDDILHKEKHTVQSLEQSIKVEVDNLSKESNSIENSRRKTLIRGKTFVIENSNVDLNVKLPEINCSNFDSNTLLSEKGSNSRIPSQASESSEKNVESSSETYSEGEVYMPSSCSYSLGEIRRSRQENISSRKTSVLSSKKTVSSSRKRNSDSSSISSNSWTRSLGEFYDS